MPVSTAADFLPDETIRENLRLDVDGDDGADMLDQHRRSAIGAIALMTGRAVLEAVEERRLPYSGGYRFPVDGSAVSYAPRWWPSYATRLSQVVIDGPDIAAVTVKTWAGDTPEVTGAWSDPATVVTPSRIATSTQGARLWPPAEGWPAKEMLLTLTVGMAGDVLEGARQAAMVYIRTAFDGGTHPQEAKAFANMVAPLKYYGPGAASRQGL